MDEHERIPVSYRNPAIVHELDVNIWSEVFSIAFDDQSLTDGTFSADVVKGVLESRDKVPNPFVDFLRVFHSLGTDEGRLIIEQAVSNFSFDKPISDDQTDREVAARLWIDSQTNQQCLDILRLALGNIEFLHKTTNVKEYSAESGFEMPKLDKKAIEAKVSSWCQENHRSEVAEVQLFEAEGVWCCNIVRGDPEKQQAIVNKNNKLDQIRYKPATCEHIRIDAETGRIGIISRSPKIVAAYRSIFGELVKNDPDFFSGENICSLKVIQEYGESVLRDNLGSRIQKIVLTELKWQGADQGSFLVKGKNCFKVLNDLRVNLTVGELVEAKLKFQMAADLKPVRVTIVVPWKIEIHDERYELVISRFLEKVGIKGNFNQREERTFWQLYPWEYTEPEWNQLIGNEHFNILRKAILFDSVDLEGVRLSDHQSADIHMTVEHLERNTIVGYGENPDVGVRVLTPSDIDGYKLNIQKVAERLAQSIGAEGGVRVVERGLWALGAIALNDSLRVKIFFATEQPSENSLNFAQVTDGVLLVPSGCEYSGAITVIPINVTGLYFEEVVADLIRALGLEGEVCPSLHTDSDLILQPSKNKAWYKKVEIPGANFSEHPFKLALHLVQTGKDVVTHDELNTILSPSNPDGRVASKAKADFIKKVKDAFDVSGIDRPEEISRIFKSVSGVGYALNCSAIIIS